MKKILSLATLCCFASIPTLSYAQEVLDPTQPLEKVAPYPQAEQGNKRHVIYLPSLENEDNAKVELIIGKMMEVDCNRTSLSGSLDEKTLEGWGFNYYVVSDLKGPISTRMACPDNSKQEKLVTVNIQNNAQLQRYNSKLPIVIYAPDDVLVKYRIWNASVETLDAMAK